MLERLVVREKQWTRVLRRISPIALLLTSLVAGASVPSLEAQRLFGRVYDAESDDPIATMDVVLLDADERPVQRTQSDEEGRFLFTMDRSGLFHLAVSRIGYDSTATASFEADEEDLYIDMRVRPTVLEAEPITVTVSRLIPALEVNGYYARRGRGRGTYIDRDRIERFGGTFPSQLLRTISGVRVRRGTVMMRNCPPKLMVDGVELQGAQIDEVVRLEAIEAMEVYLGPSQMPAEFRARASCLLMVWTKR